MYRPLNKEGKKRYTGNCGGRLLRTVLKKMLAAVCLLIAGLWGQAPDSVITDFDSHSTWGTGPGVADYTSSANHESNALAVLASAWAGASASTATLYRDIDLDIEVPTIVKVRVSYRYIGGTVSYGFGSFAGLSAIVGANGKYYERDIDYAFEFWDIADKIIALIGLLGYYPAAAASSVGALISVIDAFGQVREYAGLAENLATMSDSKVFRTTFRFKYDPSIVNRIKVSMRANAAGAVTGMGAAIMAGQVEKLELYLRQADGSWVAVDPAQNKQWVQEEINNFEEGLQWYDLKLDDISDNDHKGVYHPYNAFQLLEHSYLERHSQYGVHAYMDHLTLNSPYDSYFYDDDEYISLEYNDSDLRTLQRGGTMEAWVMPEGDAYHRGHIIYFGDDEGGDGLGDHGEIHLSVNGDGRFVFYMGDDDNSLKVWTDTSFAQLNAWQHVLVSYMNIDNRMEAVLYVNGEEVTSGSKSGSIDPQLRQAYLGKPDANTRYFRGKLKGIHIRQEPFSSGKALLAYYQSGGDRSPRAPRRSRAFPGTMPAVR
ncbi:MAG: LamG domain-containing protein [Candidatus Marinimicrobia bacterium]|nr:LamG domain-containing protein [Candidatus Neomarinimicrobiota bacterium]